MGFEQFGVVSFTAVMRTEQFVDLLRDGRLSGTVCKSCGTRYFPPRSDCRVCLSDQMDWFPISGEGTLLTFTTAMYAPAGFEQDVPYSLGVAEFPDGLKVFGRMDKSMPSDQIKAGMKVKVKVVHLDQDRLSYELTAA